MPVLVYATSTATENSITTSVADEESIISRYDLGEVEVPKML